MGAHLRGRLLGRRFLYRALLGEGVSAQVLLAEDTYRRGGPQGEPVLVSIKVLRRQHAAVGQRVRFQGRGLRRVGGRGARVVSAARAGEGRSAVPGKAGECVR